MSVCGLNVINYLGGMSSDVRQITTDFELETRIRKISQEVLQILLKK